MLERARRAVCWVLLATACVFALLIDDPLPTLGVVAAAALILPRSDWTLRPRRRTRATDWSTLGALLGAMALTLLIPDGLVRWIVIAAIFIAYIVSLLLFDRASADSRRTQHL